MLGVVGALVVSCLLWGGPATRFRGMVVLDGFALFFNLVIGYAAVLVLLLSIGLPPRHGRDSGEYYILVLFAAVGMMLMARPGDLIVVFLALELMSLSLYVLAGSSGPGSRRRGLAEVLPARRLRPRRSSSTASRSSTAPPAPPTSTGSAPRSAAPGAARDPLVLAGLGLLLVGFGFKISAVPFHMWAPDVYQGAPTP